ncbi:XdhC family protein [Loigolactobacillus jiayinensis]|uniref:XdhC family protein n=1 Tax=Loigolactobacillus jiayinensis TaxID=2486016 RepID=A0ABW1RAY4_9LACO|nr:XdhC/CoxI family protein [Loigolactobacillus jiayinensis]
MIKILETLLANLQAQRDIVLVTVTSSAGSAPRGAGAHMLVGTDGALLGTIGGGRAEYESEKLAQKYLQQQRNGSKKFILAPNDVEDLGMICGGRIEVLFTYFDHTETTICTLLQQIIEQMTQHHAAWLLLQSDQTETKLGFYSRETKFVGFEVALDKIQKTPQFWQEKQTTLYAEPISQSGKVYIFGGGHVAQALAPVLKPLDFYTIIYDNRPKFLTPEVFPTADELIVGNLDQIEEHIKLNVEDYAIVMTRGHKSDFSLEVQLLNSPITYLGVIGSKHKTALHHRLLKEKGFSDEDLKRLTMPIGIEIAAETPAEIAVSIAAQLIQSRAH